MTGLGARKITKQQVVDWSHRVRTLSPVHVPPGAKKAMRNSKQGRSTSKHNAMLDMLRAALDVAVENGAAFANVARDHSVNRPAQTPKQLKLIERADFPRLLAAMRAIGGKALHAADLTEFLAYSGARVNEARNVNWSDVL